MDITIDLQAAASKIAHEIVCERFNYNDDKIYKNNTSSYCDEAQELFNRWESISHYLLNKIKKL